MGRSRQPKNPGREKQKPQDWSEAHGDQRRYQQDHLVNADEGIPTDADLNTRSQR